MFVRSAHDRVCRPSDAARIIAGAHGGGMRGEGMRARTDD